MTGPEHYRHAEQLIAEAHEDIAPKRSVRPIKPGELTSSPIYERAMTEARIHATLALAAATALAATGPDSRAWADVAGTKYSDDT